MKKVIISILALMLLTLPAGAQKSKQTTSTVKKESILKRAKNRFQKAGREIGDAFGINEKPSPTPDDDIKIGSTYYMPIYNVNLYHGSDGKNMRDVCAGKLLARYPKATIQTCVLPQQDWLSEPVKKGNAIVGYKQSMYCFIVARDGFDGYINAKFLFSRYREVGKEALPLNGKWPSWVRTDIIPRTDYEKLLNK